MENQNKLTVSILGKEYSLITDESREIVEKAAGLIDEHLKRFPNSPISQAELLKRTTFVALKIAVNMIKKDRELRAAYSKTDTLNELLRDQTSL